MNKINDELPKPIAIINREDGSVARILYTKKDAISMYAIFTKMPDVQKGLEVFADYSEQTVKELLKDFNLPELVNVFSTRYMAKVMKKPKKINVKYTEQNMRLL